MAENRFAGSLLGANGKPILAPVLASQEPGTVEQLRKLKSDYETVMRNFTALAEEYDALKAEHDQTLKDIGELSDKVHHFENPPHTLVLVKKDHAEEDDAPSSDPNPDPLDEVS